MEFIINILTLTICCAAMAYCYVLSKRIASFKNMKDGIGALIEEMIRTTTDLHTAFEYTKNSVEKQSNSIQDKIDEGVVLAEYVEELIKKLESLSHSGMQNLQTHYHTQETVQRKPSVSVKPSQNYVNKTHTIPQGFMNNHTHHHTAVNTDRKYNTQDPFLLDQSLQEDPLADVMPAGFAELIRKRKPKVEASGEEYL